MADEDSDSPIEPNRRISAAFDLDVHHDQRESSEAPQWKRNQKAIRIPDGEELPDAGTIPPKRRASSSQRPRLTDVIPEAEMTENKAAYYDGDQEELAPQRYASAGFFIGPVDEEDEIQSTIGMTKLTKMPVLLKPFAGGLFQTGMLGNLTRLAIAVIQWSDIVTDILVAVDLARSDPDNLIWWFPVGAILCPYIVTLILLYAPFVEWLKRSPDLKHQHTYIWIVPFSLFGIILMILYDLIIGLVTFFSLGIWQPRQEGKLYHMTRLATEAFFEAFPQVVFQIYLWIRTNGTSVDLNVNTTLLGVSIMTSLVSIIKAGIYMRSFISYMKVSARIRGAIVGLREDSEEIIRLNSGEINDEDAREIAKSLRTNKSVVLLELNMNLISEDGGRAIGTGLEHNRSLLELGLKSNQLGPSAAKALAAGLKGRSHMQYLRLENNQIGDDGATYLANMLKFNSKLRTLCMERNMITKEGATSFAHVLLQNTTLKKLTLSKNDLRSHGASAIADALKENPFLDTLWLHECRIGDSGMRDISEALKVNTNLRHISLDANSISLDAVRHIGEAIQFNNGLRALSLSNNGIGDDGAIAVAEGLKQNNSLTLLNVADNKIHDIGAKEFARALHRNVTLETLKMNNNFLTGAGEMVLSKVRQGNNALKHMDVTNQHDDLDIGETK